MTRILITAAAGCILTGILPGLMLGPIDSIIADSEGIEFDWLVGKGKPDSPFGRSAPPGTTPRPAPP